MARTTTNQMNTMKENGIKIKRAAGEECIMKIQVFTKESGLKIKETALECFDLVILNFFFS